MQNENNRLEDPEVKMSTYLSYEYCTNNLVLKESMEKKLSEEAYGAPQERIYDPVADEMKKLTVCQQPVVTEDRQPRIKRHINVFSLRLCELLCYLNEGKSLDDNTRIMIEQDLYEHTSYIPVPLSGDEFGSQGELYPNNQLSKILIDNYSHLLRFTSHYFNLTLAAHVTKFMVDLIYSLQYWEVYHLLYLVPELEYFLRLVDIEVTQTSFGPLVRPPKNLFVKSMARGLEYPFPYPFYNYSYHSFDKEATKRKFANVKLLPYIDITLKNVDTLPAKRRLSNPTHAESKREKGGLHIKQSNTEFDKDMRDTPRKQRIQSTTPINEVIRQHPRQEPRGFYQGHSDNNEEFQSEYATSIRNGFTESLGSTASPNASDDNKIEGASPEAFEKNDELQFAFREGENKTFNKVDIKEGEETGNKKGKSKTGVVHQCHLLDPHTLKQCMKIFYGKNELSRHQEFVHATKKKIYKCIYCSRNGSKVHSYPRHDSLARHIRRKHGVTGKENKLAVNYAKDNVEVIEDNSRPPASEEISQSTNPLPKPQYLNNDFTVKTNYAGFLLFSAREGGRSRRSSETKEETTPNPLPVPRFSTKDNFDDHRIFANNQSHQANTSENEYEMNMNMLTGPKELRHETLPPPQLFEQPQKRTTTQDSTNTNNMTMYRSPFEEEQIRAAQSPTVQHLINNRYPNVNFNKPESSALKNNFQKFRLGGASNSQR